MAKMITTTRTIAYLLITGAVCLAAATAPEADCMTSLANASDCVNFVVKGSELRKPDAACCPELAGLIAGQPTCLCKMISNSSQFDINRALSLPSLCDIQTPPNTMCAGLENAGPKRTLLPSEPHFLIAAAIVLFTMDFFPLILITV